MPGSWAKPPCESRPSSKDRWANAAEETPAPQEAIPGFASLQPGLKNADDLQTESSCHGPLDEWSPHFLSPMDGPRSACRISRGHPSGSHAHFCGVSAKTFSKSLGLPGNITDGRPKLLLCQPERRAQRPSKHTSTAVPEKGGKQANHRGKLKCQWSGPWLLKDKLLYLLCGREPMPSDTSEACEWF